MATPLNISPDDLDKRPGPELWGRGMIQVEYTLLDAAIDMHMTGRCPYCHEPPEELTHGSQCRRCGLWVEWPYFGNGKPYRASEGAMPVLERPKRELHRAARHVPPRRATRQAHA